MATLPKELIELWESWMNEVDLEREDIDVGIIPPASPRTAGNVIVKKAGITRSVYCDVVTSYYNGPATKRGNNRCARKYIRLINGECMSYTEVRWEEKPIDLTRRVRVEEE